MPEPSSASPRLSTMPESSSASPSYFPDCVLLDPIAHVAPLKNATTAVTMTSALAPIHVSFEIVDPPGLTRCVVNCPELEESALGTPARVIAADGAFLLISVLFRHRLSGTLCDFFVYKAGPGTPWLHLLQHPCPAKLNSTRAGVLSCGDGHCLVVLPERRLDNLGRMMRYDLQVFSTETNLWTARAAPVASDLQGYNSPLLRHEPTKVCSVGGDSLAWVDVSLGVLLCNVLGRKDLEMQLIYLPPLMPANKVRLGVDLVGSQPSVPAVRDVICKDGWIRCFEIEFPDLSDMDSTEYQWTAIVSTKTMFGSDEWETFTVESSSLSPADSCFPGLFPEICDSMGKLAFNKVISTSPVLDVYHENVVYIRSKLLGDQNGWILAIDTRDKKLVTAVPFSSRKRYFNQYYLQCDFSKYISKAPENSMAKALEKCTNRENIVLLENHILAALNQLHNIEVHMASLKEQANIEKVSGYGLDHGSHKYVSYPVGEGLQFLTEITPHISTPVDAIKKEITDAHGALCKLMQNLSPNVLDEEIVE